MPSITCHCGASLSYGEKPNPIEWLMTPDFVYDLRHGVAYAEPLIEDMTRLLKCEDCERLWVFWDGPEKQPRAYAAEHL